MTISQFPHCDSRVLHAPKTCQYCDMHPDRQELRIYWGIAFTGDPVGAPEYHPVVPCPSEASRPLSAINQWDGNVPMKGGKINTDAPMFKNQTVLHAPSSRHVEIVEFDPYCPICGGVGAIDSGGTTPWGEAIILYCECTAAVPAKKAEPPAPTHEATILIELAFSLGFALEWWLGE